MNFSKRTAITIVAAGLAAGAASAEQPTTGPIAVYWMSAATTSGMGGMMGGMGRPGAGGPPQGQQPRRPGLGAMMGMMMGRGGPPGQAGGGYGGGMPGMGGGANHTLTLQLGSTQKPTGAPDAEHLPPAGLGAGASLPLVTPEVAPPEPAEPGAPPQNFQRPKGRMLIYWGCGEHAAAPPIVIDFSKIGPGQPIPHFPFITASAGRPPSPGRYATYGDWPNQRSSTTVPPGGSLVGAHTVRGDYSPEIHFNLGPSQDFLPPLNITAMSPTPAGGSRVTWSPVAGATGYYAWIMGAQERGETVVMWSSAAQANMMGALTDYLPPSEVRRLIAAGSVMPPQTTECIVPSEVVSAAPHGLISMIAYGEETDYADPPRPASAKAVWNIRWTVKVRRKSTTGMILGMPPEAMRGY